MRSDFHSVVVLFLRLVGRASGKGSVSGCFRSVGTCIGTSGERDGRKHERQCEWVLGAGWFDLESERRSPVGNVTVIVICSQVTNYTPQKWHKTYTFYYLTVPVGQESRFSSFGSSALGFLMRLQLRYQCWGLTWRLSWGRVLILVSSGCRNKVPQTGWLKSQTCMFSHSWRLEVCDQGASVVGSGESCLPGSHMATFLLCPYMVQRERTRSPVSSCKGANPFMRALHWYSKPNYLPKVLSPYTKG